MKTKTIQKRNTIRTLKSMKRYKEKISALTAYDSTFAELIDLAKIDLILIGDSLGMVIKGEENTLGVTVDEIIYHTKAVKRSTTRAHIVADMPFMSYQASMDTAVYNAGRLIKEAGAQSVKIEGGIEIAGIIKRLKKIGIPVMAHIGLKPQQVNEMGGYKMQGKNEISAKKLIEEAIGLEEAGAYSLLLEGIALETAEDITSSVKIPTIGIGSGSSCDGQIAVIYDILGMNHKNKPRFIKEYSDLDKIIKSSVKKYILDIKQQNYPTCNDGVHRKVKKTSKSTEQNIITEINRRYGTN